MKLSKEAEELMKRLPEPPEGLEPFATTERFEDEVKDIVISKDMLYMLIKTVQETRDLEKDRVRRYKLGVTKEVLERILKHEGIGKMIDHYRVEQERIKTIQEIEAAEDD